ncbi:DNA-directed RNA polymerase subunit beta [bioreactor metagenome]|uniref:DNA-directed RNA polymerase n=1 Tax=bioreactor metagenome TaxID=1076179 RepID=A0A645FNE4_9ZZZZ
MPQYDMPRTEDGTPIDLVMSPISVISRMNLGQILETTLAHAGLYLNKKYAVPVFEKYSEEQIGQELKSAGLPEDGKIQLYDGRTGEPYHQKSVVGIGYILKLVHIVDDKVHARATGPYSLVTQQPLGGEARMGGQRLGEMEVWALEAHRAAHTLQEMLTIKSDDVEGRTHTFQAIIKGQEIPEPAIPESFKVLTKELAGLALDISPVGIKEATDLIGSETDLPIDPEIKLEVTETPVSIPAEEETEGLNITDESASLDDIKEEE